MTEKKIQYNYDKIPKDVIEKFHRHIDNLYGDVNEDLVKETLKLTWLFANELVFSDPDEMDYVDPVYQLDFEIFEWITDGGIPMLEEVWDYFELNEIIHLFKDSKKWK